MTLAGWRSLALAALVTLGWPGPSGAAEERTQERTVDATPAAAASAAPSSARSEFPRPDALAALARRPTEEKVFREPSEEVDGWVLRELPPGAPALGEHAPEGAWEGRLAAFAGPRAGAVRRTEPMACLARQVGGFALARRLRPGPATLAFMSARCGVTEPVRLATVSLELHGGEGDAELQPALSKPVDEHLRELFRRGEQTAGIWYGRDEHRALVMLVAAEPAARLEAYPGRPGPDGQVVVRGELLRPAARLSGIVTRGRYGFRACEVDPGVALPRFAVRCEVDPADDAATLEIAAYGPGRVSGQVVIAAQLWTHGDPPVAFARPELTATLRAPVEGELAGTLAALVNQVRREAGLAPLTLARAQSETAAALAPRYFEAAARRDEPAMEAIVLGLRAGWQVEGAVRGGTFAAARSDDPRDAGRLVAVALSRPSGREALLHPEASILAVGARAEERSLGVVFATYALHDPQRAAAEAQAVLARLDAERTRRGLGKLEPYPALAPRVAEVAAALERGDADLHEAAKGIMPRDGKPGRPDPALGFGQRYSWVGAGERLEAIQLPAPLLEARSLQASVAVGHCRLRGSPWAEYCVVVGALRHTPPAARAPAAKK
jgi:hypothetical protein